MARLLVLALLVVVALDFSTPDAALSVASGRSVQWDDEEDGVPARRQQPSREERRVVAFPEAPRPVVPAGSRVSTERRTGVDRLNDRSAGPLLFRQALTSSARSPSTPDDH